MLRIFTKVALSETYEIRCVGCAAHWPREWYLAIFEPSGCLVELGLLLHLVITRPAIGYVEPAQSIFVVALRSISY